MLPIYLILLLVANLAACQDEVEVPRDEACHIFQSNITNKTTFIKSIGEQSGRILLLTSDDVLYDVPTSNWFRINEHLFLNGSRPLKQLIGIPSGQFPNVPSTNKLVNNLILLKLDLESHQIIFGTIQNTKFRTINCALGTGECREEPTIYEIPKGLNLTSKYTSLVAAPEPYVFWAVHPEVSSLTKYSISGSAILQASQPRYVCYEYEPDGNWHVLVTGKGCRLGETTEQFYLYNAIDRFSGFIAQDRFFMTSAYMSTIGWPKELETAGGTAKVAIMHSMAFENFFICEPPYEEKPPTPTELAIRTVIVVAIISTIQWAWKRYPILEETFGV